MKPVINYIGSKYRLIKKIESMFPFQIDSYFEPFVGGGSVFLYLKETHPEIKRAYINDNNKDIITLFKVIKKNVKGLTEYLHRLEAHKSKKDFDEIVDAFNVRSLPDTIKSALFVYLSKISFNSRLNYNPNDDMIKPNYSKSNTNKRLYEETNLQKISEALSTTKICNLDYKEFLNRNRPKKGDFVFFDPPYFVEQVNSYYKQAFSYEDYKELFKECKRLSSKGVKWMLTVNKNSKIKALFKEFHIKSISKYSWLSAGKGKEFEMIITNY